MKRALLLLFFTVIILSFSAALGQTNSYKDLVGKVNTFSNETEQTTIVIQIPEVKDSIINEELNKLLQEQVHNFQNEKFPPSNGKPGLKMFAGYTGFKDRIITFVFKTFVSDGGGSSYEFLIPFTFDIKNKKQLFLNSIFKDSTYLKTISKIVTKKAKELYKKDDPGLTTFSKEGLLPKPENFPAYYFDEDGIMFLLSPLQIGQNAAAEYKIKVLYSEIKKIMKYPKTITN